MPMRCEKQPDIPVARSSRTKHNAVVRWQALLAIAAKALKILGPLRVCHFKVHIRYHNSEY
jgi:hypothetical protein